MAMRFAERLATRALIALCLKVAGAASGLLATLLLARAMAIEDFGLVAFLTSLLSLGAIAVLLGHESLLIRELPRLGREGNAGEARGLLAHAGMVTVLLGLAAAGLGLGGIAAGLVQPAHAGSYVAACLALPLLAIYRVSGAALQGLGHVLVGDCIAQSLVQVVFLLAVAGVMLTGLALSAGLAMELRLAASATAAGAGIALVWWVMSRQPAAQSQSRTRHWLTEAPPYAVLMAALFLITESDTLIVKLMAGDVAAGLYRPPQRVVWAISFGIMAVNTLMQPRISGLAASERPQELQDAVSGAVRMSLLLTVPASLLVVGFAEPILGLFGEAYRDGATALRILALGQLVNTGMGPVAVLLNMTGHQRTTLRLTLLVVAFNAVLAVALTGTLGIAGAASATAFSMAIWNVLLWRAVRQRLDIRPTALAPGVWQIRPLGAPA